MVIATLIHNKAAVVVVFLLFTLLQKSKLPDNVIKWLIVAVLLFAPVIVSYGFQLMAGISYLAKYVSLQNAAVDSNINTNLLFTLVMGTTIAADRRQYKKVRERNWWRFLYAWQIMSYTLNAYLPTGVRYSFYFQFGLFYVFGAVQEMLKHKANKLLFYMIIIAVSLFHFIYKFYI